MTNKNTTLSAQVRERVGQKVKALRREGILPANIFGKGIDSQKIKLSNKEFIVVYKQVGETSLIDITIEGEKTPRSVLVSNIQKHPVTGDLLHADFHQVDLKQKVTATVPFEFVGEAPAIKEFGGVLVTAMSEIDVETLPSDIPESFEINLENLVAIGDTLTVKDIKVDPEIITLQANQEDPIIIIQEKRVKEEEPVEDEVDESEEGSESEEKPEGEAEATEEKSSE